MHRFSALYKEMCEKAVEIQEAWELTENDEYCDKGDREDGGLGEEVHLKTLSDWEKKDIKANKVWLPLFYQIQRRLFDSIKGFTDKAYSGYCHECQRNQKRWQKIQENFIGGAKLNVLVLMFIMDRDYHKQWDFDKQEWIET